MIKDSRVLAALSGLPEQFNAPEVILDWAVKWGQDLADILWNELVDAGIIVQDGPNWDEFDRWAASGWWEAARFHIATRDFPFVRMNDPEQAATDDARMIRYRQISSPPPIDRPGNLESTFSLARFDEGEAPSATLQRLTPETRRSVTGLGLTLDLCAGVRRVVEFKHQGKLYQKAVPSGGARHPTEVYVASFAIDGLDPGIYQYIPRIHSLLQISSGQTVDAWQHATFDLFKRWDRQPLGVTLFATRWERAMWRYRDDRSARAPLIDLGHVLMAFRQCARELGFGVYTYQKFRDAEVSSLCGLNPLKVTPLYIASLV